MIIITTTSKKIADGISQFRERTRHDGSPNKSHKDLFIEHYGLGAKNNKSMTFVMKDNGIVWCYASSLKKKYPDEVTVFYAKDLWFAELPKLFQEGGEWLAEKPRNIQHLPKALGLTKEELESVKLEDVKRFFRFRSPKKNKDTIDKIKQKFKKQTGKKGVLYLKNGNYHKIKLLDCDDEYLKIIDIQDLSIKYIKISDVRSFNKK